MSNRKIKIVGQGELPLPTKRYLTKGKEYDVKERHDYIAYIEGDDGQILCVLVGEDRVCAHISGHSYSNLCWEDVV